jgi:hypothetical protein
VVEAASTAGLASALTARAPWVFVANGAGAILAEGRSNPTLPSRLGSRELISPAQPSNA